MPAHRVREWHIEHAVVQGDDRLQQLGQALLLGGLQFIERGNRPLRKHEQLERPLRPERHQRDPVIVRGDDTLSGLQFRLRVVDEQRPAMSRLVLPLTLQLVLDFIRHDAGRPDLPVRMRIARAHHLAAILEDQHVSEVATRIELGELRSPGTHDACCFLLRQVAERQIVPRRIAQHAAFARDRLRREQSLAFRACITCRIECRKVVRENVRLRVLQIHSTVRALVAGTQIALRIVRESSRRRRCFVLPLPRT